MKKLLFLLVLPLILCLWSGDALSQNPFTSRSAEPADTVVSKTAFSSRLFNQITRIQFLIREKMTVLIRDATERKRMSPLILLLGLAFVYGAVHAAGPGHGKFVAASFVLSHRASMPRGILFAVCVALLHGFSGVIAVLCLRYFLQQGVNESLANTTDVTQVVSFGLITLLGLAILCKHGYELMTRPKAGIVSPTKTTKKNLASWVLALGLVPCPAVLMVMLFCLSMEALLLGLLMAVCISLGMAVTISLVVTIVLLGKSGILNKIPDGTVLFVEGVVGVIAGAGVSLFGLLLLLATI